MLIGQQWMALCCPANQLPHTLRPAVPFVPTDCTELLVAAQEQQRQVAAYLQQLPEVASGEDEEAAGRAAAQRAHLEGLLQERQAAAALVEEVLELTQAVSRRLSGL